MKLLSRIEGKINIRNQVFREKLRIISITSTMEHGQLRCFGHVLRRGDETIIETVICSEEIKKNVKGNTKKDVEGRSERSGREKRNKVGIILCRLIQKI